MHIDSHQTQLDGMTTYVEKLKAETRATEVQKLTDEVGGLRGEDDRSVRSAVSWDKGGNEAQDGDVSDQSPAKSASPREPGSSVFTSRIIPPK